MGKRPTRNIALPIMMILGGAAGYAGASVVLSGSPIVAFAVFIFLCLVCLAWAIQ